MLDGTRLGSSIWQSIKNMDDKSNTEALWQTIAREIINHITQNAEVIPTQMIAPANGGAVTGTGAIK